MFDNNNDKNFVMVKDDGITDKPYEKLKSSEGLRQIGEILQTKHNEMTSIFDMVFNTSVP